MLLYSNFSLFFSFSYIYRITVITVNFIYNVGFIPDLPLIFKIEKFSS